MEQQVKTEQRLTCSTVRDLLPLYIEKMTGEASNRSIREHLEGCPACREALREMSSPIPVETAPEIRDFKRYLKLSRIELFQWIMGAAAGIALLSCFIVNLSVEKRLSWFYIVFMGILTAYAPVFAGIRAEKHKFEIFLAVLTVCVPFLVGTVQFVLYEFMERRELWFFRMGIPIMALWLAIVWISVACRKLFHLNLMLALGILCVLAVPGNYLTNLTIGAYQGIEDFGRNFISNGLGNVVAAAVFLLTGIYLQSREKK